MSYSTVGDVIEKHLQEKYPLGYDPVLVKKQIIDNMKEFDGAVSIATINRYYNTYIVHAAKLPYAFFIAVQNVTTIVPGFFIEKQSA